MHFRYFLQRAGFAAAMFAVSMTSAFASPPMAAPKPAVAPKAVAAPVTNAEDCVVVDPAVAKAGNVGGDWKVALGTNAFLDFGANELAATRASDVIQHYHFTRQCFVRRPNASMMYWKNGVAVPPGNMAGQDCIAFHPETAQAIYVTGRWKVMDGALWLLDYGPDRTAAEDAARIIHTYALNRECFIARPHVVMQYWLAE
jgi:hypothetical protein